MKQFDLNEIPEKIKSGEISKKCAVHQLALYLSKNPALFGLKTKDEDFKSEVMLLFLERGENTIDLYDPEYGTFFTYFFCFIKSLTNTVTRLRASTNVRDYHTITESISNYEQYQEKYSSINYNDFEKPKVPYAYKQVSPEAFQIACKSSEYSVQKFLSTPKTDDSYKHLKERLSLISPSMAEKILLILSLKSAYYISDKQIKAIAEICNIEVGQLYDTIQQIKQELIVRETSKKELELRRNKAYYHHKKYRSRINWTDENRDDFSEYERKALIDKYNKQTESWIKLNEQLKKGAINIRPTNKAIAKVLGLCERQISYYIKNANIIGLEI